MTTCHLYFLVVDLRPWSSHMGSVYLWWRTLTPCSHWKLLMKTSGFICSRFQRSRSFRHCTSLTALWRILEAHMWHTLLHVCLRYIMFLVKSYQSSSRLACWPRYLVRIRVHAGCAFIWTWQFNHPTHLILLTGIVTLLSRWSESERLFSGLPLFSFPIWQWQGYVITIILAQRELVML